MSRARTIDVGELLESRPLNRYHIFIAVLGFLVLWVDGLDFSAGMVGAPAILREFHAGRGAMGNVFGAGSFGAMLGALLFGYVADRWGRRVGIIASVLAYSVATLASAYASSLNELMVLRFITGMGVAGVVPNTISLLTETAPRRYRASFVMLTLIGIAAGNSSAGLVAGWFMAANGWQIVFVTGGVVGLLMSVLLFFVLPESIRFLAVKNPDGPQLRRLVARLAPDLDLSAGTGFVLAQPKREGVALKQLFTGDQRIATPLLWVGYFTEALTFMTLLSWMSVFLVSAGLTQTQAAFAFSYAGMGGICAVLVMARILDRFGPVALVASALAAIVSVSLMGADLPQTAIIAMAILGVAFCTGTHNALNGTVGMFYPTAIRGKGVGYATGMGRVGLMVGPVVTGWLLAANLPLQDVLYVVAAPYVVVALACWALGRLYQRRFATGAGIEAARAADDAPMTLVQRNESAAAR
ncbi:MAG TPA: MFS transporter [Stellaceae bacterium]|nr:MFS transporter [Stellaceae bacterium]